MFSMSLTVDGTDILSGNFKMRVDAGRFTDSEILVMLGQNGTGKTTFIRMLAGLLKPDNNEEVPRLNVSYKPQKISPTFPVRRPFFRFSLPMR
jgi:translation initiation factor RLI1